MDKKFIKKYKHTIIVVVIFIIMFILGVKVIEFLVPNSGTPVYGNRLDGITEIPNDQIEQLKNKIKEENIVTEVNTSISGKILNVKITVEDTASLSASKKVGDKVLTNLSEEVLSQYDIQVYLLKTNKEENDFPIIGYKKNTNEVLTWTKDREKEEVGETK